MKSPLTKPVSVVVGVSRVRISVCVPLSIHPPVVAVSVVAVFVSSTIGAPIIADKRVVAALVVVIAIIVVVVVVVVVIVILVSHCGNNKSSPIIRTASNV